MGMGGAPGGDMGMGGGAPGGDMGGGGGAMGGMGGGAPGGGGPMASTNVTNISQMGGKILTRKTRDKIQKQQEQLFKQHEQQQHSEFTSLDGLNSLSKM